MKPNVFLTRQLPPAVMERLERETDLAWHREDPVATAQRLAIRLRNISRPSRRLNFG